MITVLPEIGIELLCPGIGCGIENAELEDMNEHEA